MSDVASALTERGIYLPDARLARLVLLHNPYAVRPLTASFAGPHDDQYGLRSGQGYEWGHVATGRLRHEVPDDGTRSRPLR